MLIFLPRDFGEDKNKRRSFHRFLPAISKQGPFLSKPWITYTAPETRNVWSWFYILLPDSQTSQIPGFAGVEFLVRIPSSPSPPPLQKKHHTRRTTHQNRFIPVKSDEIKQKSNIFSQKKKCRKLIPKPKMSTYHHHLSVFQFPYFWHKKKDPIYTSYTSLHPHLAKICKRSSANSVGPLKATLTRWASFQHPPKARGVLFFNSAVGVFWWDYKLVVAHLVRLMFEFYPFSHTHGVFRGKWVYISNIRCPTCFFWGGVIFWFPGQKTPLFRFWWDYTP